MPNFKKQIVITGTFIEFHRWLEAPEEVSYLANIHRHLFTFKIFFPVDHNDRQLEFHLMKEFVSQIIWKFREEVNTLEWSCEKWATEIGEKVSQSYPVTRVEIWEDNECGAIVEKV